MRLSVKCLWRSPWVFRTASHDGSRGFEKEGGPEGEQAIPVLVATGVTRAAVLEEPGGVVPLPPRKELPGSKSGPSPAPRPSEWQSFTQRGARVIVPTRMSGEPPVIGDSTADKGEPR